MTNVLRLFLRRQLEHLSRGPARGRGVPWRGSSRLLATGDGKGYYQDDGFLYDVEMFVQDGWGIELLSWEHSCNRMLRVFAEKHGKFISLDTNYDKISFIKGGRVVQPLR